jgi:exosortase C (VPDSG-CTERM-specific)
MARPKSPRIARHLGFLGASALLVLIFIGPLWDLAWLATKRDLYSHLFLIPLMSSYVMWLKRDELDCQLCHGWPWVLGAIPVGFGIVVLLGGMWARHRGWDPPREDWLCLMMGGLVSQIVLSAGLFYGWRVVWSMSGPLLILCFLLPFPRMVEHGIEEFLQRTSALAASALFWMGRMDYVREGLVFRLPGISLEVARECSGIHSTLVLFLTSLVASNLFLRTGWRRALLVLSVIPLGILRNGFRIFTLGMLCVHVDRGLIDSWIHHQGGPVFFVLSLVPLFGLLWLLQRGDAKEAEGVALRAIPASLG